MVDGWAAEERLVAASMRQRIHVPVVGGCERLAQRSVLVAKKPNLLLWQVPGLASTTARWYWESRKVKVVVWPGHDQQWHSQIEPGNMDLGCHRFSSLLIHPSVVCFQILPAFAVAWPLLVGSETNSVAH